MNGWGNNLITTNIFWNLRICILTRPKLTSSDAQERIYDQWPDDQIIDLNNHKPNTENINNELSSITVYFKKLRVNRSKHRNKPEHEESSLSMF